MTDQVPTLYEWAGGAEALEQLTEEFYARVRKDELLAPLFARMADDHPKHVATFLGEVLGGPERYTEHHGGYRHMLSRHRGRAIKAEQRARWVELMLEAMDVVGLPDDAEFRSAFIGYIEFGSRRAMANSQPGAGPTRRTTIKKWGWGEALPGDE
ncbi:group II truncated hemoglobin [Streptomyces sp. RB6PN25]|uniref:Group II truncated hemoglobin n=1 Tax=Streptomyces humicola TaxID=2953240 RepID=A0ABT1Q132_9ACTN|nr:group II truncated hemoglobin [Streptomyces humicola]MCQ4083642.1 group II truncated hemoglobin [Streptomyces humicola]